MRRGHDSDRAREDAEARAEEAIEERDALVAQLDAARTAVQGMQAAVDARLEVIDAKRNRTVQALKEAEARAEQATRERDALAAQLEAAQQAGAGADAEQETRGWPLIIAARVDAEFAAKNAEARAQVLAAELDAARQAAAHDAQTAIGSRRRHERIRALELQLFERDRGTQDRDVELASLLDAAVRRGPTNRFAVRARHRFSTTMKVHIDDAAGELVDLSVGGAQVLCPGKPELNHVAAVSLLSDDDHLRMPGTDRVGLARAALPASNAQVPGRHHVHRGRRSPGSKHSSPATPRNSLCVTQDSNG